MNWLSGMTCSEPLMNSSSNSSWIILHHQHVWKSTSQCPNMKNCILTYVSSLILPNLFAKTSIFPPFFPGTKSLQSNPSTHLRAFGTGARAAWFSFLFSHPTSRLVCVVGKGFAPHIWNQHMRVVKLDHLQRLKGCETTVDGLTIVFFLLTIWTPSG